MDSVVRIDVKGLAEAKAAVGEMLSPDRLARMNVEIGFSCQERTADHIARASVSRHRTADGLGAQHSRFLEFAPGRVRSLSAFTGGGAKPETFSRDATADGVTVVVANTPGLRRAYGPLTVRPVRAKCLTIPLHADAYCRTVAELRAEGRRIFRPKGTGILAEATGETETAAGSDGKPHRRRRLRALYALRKSVTLPRDEGLLPGDSEIADWAAETAEAFAELWLSTNGATEVGSPA